ncbi:CD2-associated protein isoform X3 [Astatotilapia calliptera]|uniref:CD2-associated protein isoform X3 n=1 Tax=Astatotilapia calliptera TaxID=8154 RepID=UPI000E41E8A1|nr:CD2-associated protein isoform X3 [Astatotilapia calliptera]
MEVVVEYDYDALHDDELTLRPGDIIKNVRYVEEDGWMEGDLNGKRGLFPDNFVKELKKDPKEGSQTADEPKEEQPQKREKVGNVAGLVQRISTLGIPTGAFQPPVPAASKKPKKRQCKVLFEYQPQNEDELELKVGNIVEITEEVEEGWWSGTLNGKSGIFPSNFVKELEPMGDIGESNDTSRADDTDGNGAESIGTPTSPLPTPGNGGIAQPKKIKGVGFGDIFKDASYKKRHSVQTPDKEEKNENPIPSIPLAAKPAPPNTTDSQKADGDSKAKAKEYCKVAYAYKATNEDELTLNEGDIVHVLSKDTGEPGWWRGEVGGKEGVFPDNFVVMISEAEKEKPKKPPPPSKSTALKPEIPSADKKPHLVRPEDRVDKPIPDLKPKPAAPLVPPKKPVPPPGKGRPGMIPPKRPEKPLASSPSFKHNGEVPSTRPKSDSEPLPLTKPVSADSVEKSGTDLMSFDDLSSTSEKLSHLTTNRPKMTGRRLPTQFGGGQLFPLQPNKEVSVEKTFKIDEEDAKPKLTETRKPSTNTLLSPSFHKPDFGDFGASLGSKAKVEHEESSSQLEELRSQMKELQLTVELLKSQQMKEITELRGELDDERQKRVSLQMEIEKLKRTIHST